MAILAGSFAIPKRVKKSTRSSTQRRRKHQKVYHDDEITEKKWSANGFDVSFRFFGVGIFTFLLWRTVQPVEKALERTVAAEKCC